MYMNSESKLPRRRRKAQRPPEIIEAAFVEFASHGFARTKLVDIAERAGIAKGTIYRYFNSKEALFEAVLSSRFEPALAQIGLITQHSEIRSADLLREILVMLHRQVMQSDLPVLMRILIGEGHQFPRLTEFYHRKSITRIKALINKVIQRGISAGEFSAGPATDEVLVLVAPAIVAGIWRTSFDAYEHLDAEKVMHAHIDLVLGRLCSHN